MQGVKMGPYTYFLTVNSTKYRINGCAIQRIFKFVSGNAPSTLSTHCSSIESSLQVHWSTCFFFSRCYVFKTLYLVILFKCYFTIRIDIAVLYQALKPHINFNFFSKRICYKLINFSYMCDFLLFLYATYILKIIQSQFF